MNNIIKEKPSDILHGRTLFSINFINDQDIINKNILDIGCGYGWLEFNMLRKCFSGITGIEISEKDLKTAKDCIRSDKVFFKIGSAIDIPFGNNRFDTVVSFEVIEHIPKNTEKQMFKEVNRVLIDNGYFYLSTPYNSLFSIMFDPAWYFGHRHYSTKFIKKIAGENGFEVKEIINNGGFWTIFGAINMYIAKWIFRRKPFFDNFMNIMADKEYSKKSGVANIFIKMKKVKKF
ncbi:MAG: class I SAM-dependent methyltransferase [Patescibacteria group bacterium]